MRKRYRYLWLALGLVLVFIFRLQIILPIAYISTGFLFYLFFFCWAKAKNLDESYNGWYYVLNSAKGMFYFLLSGSVLWGPVLITLFLEMKEKFKRDSKHAWMQYIKNPMQMHRDWFNNFYQ
ncbi:hypothetical protein SAMN05518848_11354 [Paenibacillus sp. PDC88]|nr:hypothetical protein SAMN05518848_11354 [Paenibacillus sp. PDC88]SFS89770.1 hypothetical protein SAMN04488601_106174 [Paenibacillus sp. 453mf]